MFGVKSTFILYLVFLVKLLHFIYFLIWPRNQLICSGLVLVTSNTKNNIKDNVPRIFK